MSSPRILLFDIETTGLYADWDHLLCMSYQWYGEEEEVHTIKQTDWEMDNLLDDEGAVSECVNILSQADIWIGWYSYKFDEPFVRTRSMRWGGDGPPAAQTQVRHLDLWDICRRRLRFRSNRLDNVSRYWPAEKEDEVAGMKHRKTAMDYNTWQLARYGNPDALEYVYEHCEADIHVLREVFEKFRKAGILPPSVRLDRYFGDHEGYICPRCGEPVDKYQRRGTSSSGRSRVQMFPCLHWGQLFEFKNRDPEIR